MVRLSAATTLNTLHPNNQRRGPPTTLNLVIPSEAEGPVVRLSAATTLNTLHPNNQRRGPPTTLNLVIPSDAPRRSIA